MIMLYVCKMNASYINSYIKSCFIAVICISWLHFHMLCSPARKVFGRQTFALNEMQITYTFNQKQQYLTKHLATKINSSWHTLEWWLKGIKWFQWKMICCTESDVWMSAEVCNPLESLCSGFTTWARKHVPRGWQNLGIKLFKMYS